MVTTALGYTPGTSNFSGDYDDLTDKPTIPTATSDLNNDSGFITSSALSGYATETWVGQQGYLTSVSWNDISSKPTFATVATSGDYDDLLNKPSIPDMTDYYDKDEVDEIVDNVAEDIPEVIANPATTTATLTSILINGTSYAVSGGGSGGGTEIIYINSTTSTTSGTLSAADLAKIVANPTGCVIRKYGSAAQYQQDYELTEISWTDNTQTTVSSYTYELVQLPQTSQVRDRKIVVTASTGDWTFTNSAITIPSVTTRRANQFSWSVIVNNGSSYVFDISGTVFGYGGSSATNNFSTWISNVPNSYNTDQKVVPVSGILYFNSGNWIQFNILGVYRPNSSSIGILYRPIALNDGGYTDPTNSSFQPQTVVFTTSDIVSYSGNSILHTYYN